MRFEAGKAYPHPVLRQWSTDYQKVEFEVEINATRPQNRTAVKVKASFRLSDPTLLNLVDENKARYVLRVLASKTHFRKAFTCRKTVMEHVFEEGVIHGLVELSPFLVCVSRLRAFKAPSWHSDYEKPIDVEPGSVLAEDRPVVCWIDTADETPVGSIFQLNRSNDSTLNPGTWRCRLDGDQVTLEMSAPDYDRFVAVRNSVNGTADSSYLMNAVYLPALIYVLEEADREEDHFGDRRWYRALGASLEREGLKPLGSQGKLDRVVDAQKLFQRPFGQMPLLTRVTQSQEES